MDTPFHQISSGFHDIKPIPEFSPFPLSLSLLLVALLLLALIVWLIAQKPAQAKPYAPPEPADKRAFRLLNELDKQRQSESLHIRELFESLSLLLRTYIEDSLNFSARELTLREISHALPSKIRKALPALPREKHAELAEQTLQILHICHQGMFSDRAEQIYSIRGATVEQLFTATPDIIREFAHWLTKEQERHHGVIAAGQKGGS